MKEVYIASAVRTPIGSFGGKLSGFSATQLGTFAIKGALDKSGVGADQVDEVFMGNVLSANLGQSPARQASIGAGIGDNVTCTTVNKAAPSGIRGWTNVNHSRPIRLCCIFRRTGETGTTLRRREPCA